MKKMGIDGKTVSSVFYSFLNTEEKWFVVSPTPFFNFILLENHGKVNNIMMSIKIFFFFF